MRVYWKDLEQQAIAMGWTPANFLSQLCERELEHRLQQRHKRYLTEAKLPEGKCMDTLELASVQGINPSRYSVPWSSA
jgi:DNA replication protein DnaC